MTTQARTLTDITHDLQVLQNHADTEGAHMEGDALLCEALFMLTPHTEQGQVRQLVTLFSLLPKWYA